jgi:hypothetical protein
MLWSFRLSDEAATGYRLVPVATAGLLTIAIAVPGKSVLRTISGTRHDAKSTASSRYLFTPIVRSAATLIDMGGPRVVSHGYNALHSSLHRGALPLVRSQYIDPREPLRDKFA